MLKIIRRNAQLTLDIFKLSSLRSIFWLIATLIVVFISIICNVYYPYILKTVVDMLVVDPSISNSVTFAFITYCMVLATGKIIAESKFVLYSLWENTILPNIYVSLYDRAIKSSFEYLGKNNGGTVAAKIDKSVTGFKSFCFDCIFFFFPLIIELILVSSSIYIVLKDIWIASILFIGVSIYSIIVISFSNRLKKQQRLARNAGMNLIRILSDVFGSWKDIKFCAGFKVTEKLVGDKARICAEKIHDVYTQRVVVGICQVSVLVLTIIMTNYISIKNMVAGEISIGGIILVNGYIYQILRPLEGLGINYRNISRSFNEFISFMLEVYNDNLQESEDGIPQDVFKIKLENVSKHGILKNFNLQIDKGESVAIVGKSGSGKTTLLNIIANIEKDYQGSVYYDNLNVSKLAWCNYFPAVYLTADARLLLQSPYSNLMLLNSNQADAVSDCLKQVYLDDKLFNAQIEIYENCETLSTGQKQRLLIARSLLVNRKVRIFDESLSSIDHQTQIAIVDNLLKDNAGYINIFVTHNEVLATKFDRVIRVEEGQVIEEKVNLAVEL